MELFSQRQRAQQEAEARARGESIDPLTDEATQAFRYHLKYAFDRLFSDPRQSKGSHHSLNLTQRVAAIISRGLREEYGRRSLSGRGVYDEDDLEVFVLGNASTHELMDIIDVCLDLASDAEEWRYDVGESEMASRIVEFTETIRRRLVQSRMAYDVVGGKVVPKRSEELHEEVVVPALTLLHDRPRFADVERQYRDALDEIAHENWADAITDANAAVEVTLRLLTGLQQGQLPALLAEARQQGLFGDQRLGQLKKLVDGFAILSDIRNKESDAHGNAADGDTAWLTVHWSGALIRYLVERAEKLGL